MVIQKATIAAAFFLLILTTAVAQTSQRDSLEHLLGTNLSDSVRLRTQIKLSNLYQFHDYDRSLSHAQEAVAQAERMGQYWALAESYRNLAYIYTLNGDYSTALKYDNIALQNATASGDSASITASYSYLGNDYYDIGEYDDAYFYFTQSYRLARATNDSLNMAIALHNVGRVFKELQEYDRALNHFALSLKMSNQIGDKPGLPYYYDEFGDVMMRKGNYDSALTALSKALTLINELNLGELKPKTFSKIASSYLYKKDFEKAFAYYDSTQRLYEKTNNQYGKAEVCLGRGIVFLEQDEYDDAERLIEEGLSIARRLNARVLEIECYRYLHTIWEKRGDFRRALDYFKRYKTLEDSLFSQEVLHKLYRDQIRYETEARDMEIAALSQIDARQKDALKREEFIRNILAVVFGLCMLLLITVYRSGQRRKEINKLLVKHQKEMETRSEELERLNQVKDKFFSIISHDLRSPINALSGILDVMARGGLSQAEFAEHTKELRIRFNHTRTLLNNLLDWTLLQMDKLSLQAARIDLSKIIDENIQLLASLNAKQITLINNVREEAIAFADSNTINLVIRNLITNAIKFTNDGGTVIIDAKDEGGHWLVSVQDNGIGISPEVQQMLFDKTSPYTTRGTANEKGTGLGLILCKEFVEKNGGKIWVESTLGKGSTFWVTIPKPNL
ncbi:MAG TPA: tetratricopeptide repeat-containing sensor histidine kinase [Cyclobacteriaceae bacterium]|jgi:signal transduction histidine kinase